MSSLKKLRIHNLIRLSLVIILVFNITILGILINFLYINLYQSITQVPIIYSLQAEFALESVDIQTFKQIGKNLEEKGKEKTVIWEKIKNPFVTPVVLPLIRGS